MIAYYLFGWACIESAVFTDKTLNKNGIFIELSSESGLFVLRNLELNDGCIPIHNSAWGFSGSIYSVKL